MHSPLEHRRRRLHARVVLERLEDRLALSAAPVAATVPIAPPVLGPSVVLVLGIPAPVAVPSVQLPPRQDTVIFDAILMQGGGQREALPHFPESGGNDRNHAWDGKPQELTAGDASEEEEVQVEAFSGDPGVVAHTAETTTVFAQTAEAILKE